MKFTLFPFIIVMFCLKMTLLNAQVQDKKVQVLLVGTSHWGNYQKKGLDVAQTSEVDILSDQYQKELAFIADKIAAFNPGKIFVERPLTYQPKLDSLYQLFRSNENWGKDKRNEIYQLGFRVAAKLAHQKVYGIDYRDASFPFDSLMVAMSEAGQESLINEFMTVIKGVEDKYNLLVREKKSLMDIFRFLNGKEERRYDLGWYINGASKAGVIDNYIGSFLASEWIRRNIYSYGLIQKYLEKEDQRIMILMGASHMAVLENLIGYNTKWEIVELTDIVD